MTTVIPFSSAVQDQQETQPLSPIISRFFVPTTTISTFSIEETRPSEHATIYFTHKAFCSERYVMKELRDYKDTRYSLETVQKRQECQLQALERNRKFSPDIYVGLAKIKRIDTQNSRIDIEGILASPTSDMLEPNADYALIMHQLPEERSLVTLLKKENSEMSQRHARLLTKHIAQMHLELLASPFQEESMHWGQYEQLKEKLSQNLELLDCARKMRKDGLNYQYLEKNVAELRDTLQLLFQQGNFRAAFENRAQEQYTRLCHGDLKVPHIWIMPYDAENCQAEPERFIKILDAIDFNPLFCNIDILSDFAMLVTDIHTRTGSAKLADTMVADYLQDTRQDKPEARLVLGYYLVEKALVGAAISILFDNLPALGLEHLAVAMLRLHALEEMQQECLSLVY